MKWLDCRICTSSASTDSAKLLSKSAFLIRGTLVYGLTVSVLFIWIVNPLTTGPMRSLTHWMGKIGLGIVGKYRKNTDDTVLWLDLGPPKRCWSANPPIPVNVTLYGNKSFADDQVKRTVFLLKGKICTQRHRHKKNTNTKAEIAEKHLQAKEHHGFPGNHQNLGEKPETYSPSQASGGINPADTLI